MAVKTLERETVSDSLAEQILLDAFRRREGKLTKADAVAGSGLSQAQTERALTVVLRDYRSHLSATESGELVYELGPKPVRRTAVTWRERLARFGRVLWRGFKFGFKIWIAVTLVVYFVAFVAMLLAMLFARSSGSDRDDDREGGFSPGMLFWFWGWGPSADPYGRRRARKRGKPFYRSVFDFVFGPARTEPPPLQDEREILAYIRAHRGRITATDLVRMFGWELERAEQEATRLMVQYGGEPEVTEDGVVVYVFRNLRVTAGAEDLAVRPRDAWERQEQPAPLTGNTPGMNVGVAALNGFNLLAPLWIVPAFEAARNVSLEGWEFLVRDFPLAFSALFFAVPIGRALVERRRRREGERRNALRRILQRVFARGGAPAAPEQLATDPVELEVLEKKLVELGGDVEADEQGNVRYGFPKLREELAAVEKVRQAAPASEQDPGAVIWTSKD